MDLHVCSACGRWAGSPDVLADDAVTVCERCGHRQRFVRLPMFALTGASGTGKSTVVSGLAGRLAERVVVLEQDLLWIPELRRPDGEHRAFRCTWARLVAALAQNGRPVLLSGTVVPGQLEVCPQRRFIGDIHYLALVCDGEALAVRLHDRPAWREFDQQRIGQMVEFNEWVREHAPTTTPPMTLLDTTHGDVQVTAAAVRAWVLGKLTSP